MFKEKKRGNALYFEDNLGSSIASGWLYSVSRDGQKGSSSFNGKTYRPHFLKKVKLYEKHVD